MTMIKQFIEHLLNKAPRLFLVLYGLGIVILYLFGAAVTYYLGKSIVDWIQK
jgi:hypothetical protein